MCECTRRLVIRGLTEEMDGHVQRLRTRPPHLYHPLSKVRQQKLRIGECRLGERDGEKTSHPGAGVGERGDVTVEGVVDGAGAAPEHGSAPVSLI